MNCDLVATRGNDTLARFAARVGADEAHLRAWNPKLDRIGFARLALVKVCQLAGGTTAHVSRPRVVSRSPAPSRERKSGRLSCALAVVRRGESLAAFALRHATTESAVIETNKLGTRRPSAGDILKVCRVLAPRRTYGDIEPPEDHDPWARVGIKPPRHAAGSGELGPCTLGTLATGETLADFARRFDSSVDVVRRFNSKRLGSAGPRPGQLLKVCPILRAGARPEATSDESVGSCQSGRLLGGEQLISGAGLVVSNPARAWGTALTVWGIKQAAAQVRARFGDTHGLRVEDLSRRDHCPLNGHKSHCSGRDADLGLYFHGGYSPTGRFLQTPSQHQFDAPRNKALVEALVATGAVQKIFIDDQWIARLEEAGLSVRARAHLQDWPNHKNHYHVRFRCPPDDSRCVR